MAVTYDESVIVSFAERLYRRAANIVITYTVLGGLVGALVGLAVAGASRIHGDGTNGVAVVTAVIGMVIGGLIGNERAFALRLLAQQALCQVAIERNTRAVAFATHASLAPPPSAFPRTVS